MLLHMYILCLRKKIICNTYWQGVEINMLLQIFIHRILSFSSTAQWLIVSKRSKTNLEIEVTYQIINLFSKLFRIHKFFSINQEKYTFHRIVDYLSISTLSVTNKNFMINHERSYFHGICELFLDLNSYFRTMMKFETNITQYLKIYHNKNKLNTL